MSRMRHLKSNYTRSKYEKREEKYRSKMMRELLRNEKCMGKVSRTEDDAKTAIEYYRMRDGIELAMYRCRIGDHWHLTSQIA